MNKQWEQIADSLRGEIAEYGALLNGFESQQRALFARDSEGVLRISGEIEAHVQVLRGSREHRERIVTAFALANNRPASSTLRSLVDLFEPAARPLIEALIKEINVLIHRVRRANRHNHMLLSRTVAAQREMLRALSPESYGSTYSAAGRVAGVAPAITLQAAG